MCRQRGRPGAGGAYRRAAGEGGQGGQRRRPPGAGGAHRHHRRRRSRLPGRDHHGDLRQGRRADQQRVPGAVDETVGGNQFSAHPRRDRVERAGRAAADQAFTPALETAHGSIVNVNSMVLRHSQAKYGAYKMAKSALLSMSQSLATELGEKGHPGQFGCAGLHLGRYLAGLLRAPGGQVRHHGRADLRGHRRQLRPQTPAHRGRSRFGHHVLASDLSSGITGQTLDVNCGEYHT